MVLEDMIQGKLNIVTVTVTVGSLTVTSHCHTDLASWWHESDTQAELGYRNTLVEHDSAIPLKSHTCSTA